MIRQFVYSMLLYLYNFVGFLVRKVKPEYNKKKNKAVVYTFKEE